MLLALQETPLTRQHTCPGLGRRRGAPKGRPTPVILMWQFPSWQQAQRLFRADPSLDMRSLTSTLNMLRAGNRAPAAPQQRIDLRNLCSNLLGGNLGSVPVTFVQMDAALSLGQNASCREHLTMWSLAEDSEMVDTPDAVGQTVKDEQFQMLYGKNEEPVLTGKATAVRGGRGSFNMKLQDQLSLSV